MTERYEFPVGRIPRDHPAVACPECHGEGGWLEELPAHCAALEPRYRSVTCHVCDGDKVGLDFECFECDAPLDPLGAGVGAIVETRIANPALPWQGVPFYRLLCGACAFAAVICDAK